MGRFRPVDFPAIDPSASKHGDAETPVQHAGLHMTGGHLRTVCHGLRREAPDPKLADGPAPGSSRHGRGSASAAFGSEAGLKPMTDGTRRMLPFGSPKGEGLHDQASRRRTGGVASSQVDRPQGGTGAGAHRHRRWRDRSPLQLPECMDGPAPPVSVPPAAALREVRLSGFPEALAEAPRHRCGSGRRVPDAAPTGGAAVRFVVQPRLLLGATLRESPAEAGGGLRPL